VQCCTNRIEGAWKISKDHFKRINGTNTKRFEEHLAHVIWKNHVHKSNMHDSFFNLLKEIFPLNGPAKYTHPTPLFDTWMPPTKLDEKAHNFTIIQESGGDSTDDELLNKSNELQQSNGVTNIASTSNANNVALSNTISPTEVITIASSEDDETWIYMRRSQRNMAIR